MKGRVCAIRLRILSGRSMDSEDPFIEIIVRGFLKALKFHIGILLLKERNLYFDSSVHWEISHAYRKEPCSV